MPTSRPPINCIYCGGPVAKVRKGKGEHCFLEALGARVTIDCVCQGCNNAFSVIDKELASCSPLQTIVQQELGTKGQRTWGYDRHSDVALETNILPGFVAPPLWPQIVLLGDCRVSVFFSYPENMRDGADVFLRAFRKCLRNAILSLTSERKSDRHFRWEIMRGIPDRGKYPPRVFCQRHYPEFDEDMTFTCRYTPDVEQGRVLYWLKHWLTNPLKTKLEISWGIRDPEFYSGYDPTKALRACTKIALNCLAKKFGPEKINLQSFTAAINFARWNLGNGPDMERTGFLYGHDTKSLACPDNCHLLYLERIDRGYIADFSFFGGAAGFRTIFLGPCLGFNVLRFTVPLHSREPEIEQSMIFVPRIVRTTWTEIDRVYNTLPVRNVRSKIVVSKIACGSEPAEMVNSSGR